MKEVIGGYSVEPILDGNTFFGKKKYPNITFEITEVVKINNREYMYIGLSTPYHTLRIKKSNNAESTPLIIADIINLEKKEILFTIEKEFLNGVGIGTFLFQYNFLSQWELPVIDIICRAFLYGDVDTFKKIITEYSIKYSDSIKYHFFGQ